MLTDTLLYHRNHKIPPALSADLTNEEIPFPGHVAVESCHTFFQGCLEMFESTRGEEERKRIK